MGKLESILSLKIIVR